MKKKILVFGYGKMGKIHGKYLDHLREEWDYFDKFSKEKSNNRVYDLNGLSEYTHLIISTPTSCHEENLSYFLKNFNGKILVEKPGVMSLSEIDLIGDERVSVGMVERFNPSFKTLKKNIDEKKLLNIDFTRCSAKPVSRIEVNSFVDVGIHDIDLFYTLFPDLKIENVEKFRNKNTFFLNVTFNEGKIARFVWSNETFHKERKIYARQTNCNFECDLSEQIVKKYSVESVNNRNTVEDLFVEKGSSILAELENFIYHNNEVDAKNSHQMFLSLLEEDEGRFKLK